MKKHSVAIIGAQGYVGSALCKAFASLGDSTVTPVTRENYDSMKAAAYDFLINAAMPSKRFWAKNNPAEDFRETVQKTADLLYGWKYQKFVQISTVSARCELDQVYGRHKAAAESLCRFGDHLIVRLSSMYDASLNKGALIDILNQRKVFVSGESRYPFASLDFVTGWISRNLHRKGIVEVGAKNTVSLQQVADHLKYKIEFKGAAEDQTLENPSPDFPDARLVLKFLDSIKQSQSITR